MSDYNTSSLSSAFVTGPARLDAAVAITMAFGWNPAIQSLAARAVQREEFLAHAQAFGLSMERAEMLLRSDGLIASVTGRQGSAHERLEDYARYGYLTVLLGEVLAKEDLAVQTFSYITVLNRDMDHAYAKAFSEMSRDSQRGLVLAAIELSTQLGGEVQGWPLERAMNAVMPYQEEA